MTLDGRPYIYLVFEFFPVGLKHKTSLKFPLSPMTAMANPKMVFRST